MTNFTAADLLRYSPLEALFISYNEEHGTDLNPRFVEVVEVVPSTGPSVQVKVRARNHQPNSEKERATGEGTITVNRLDLNDFFGGSIKVPYENSVVSRDVVRLITQRNGIVFDESDVEDSLITPESNLLTANPNSLRWYGSVPVVKPV